MCFPLFGAHALSPRLLSWSANWGRGETLICSSLRLHLIWGRKPPMGGKATVQRQVVWLILHSAWASRSTFGGWTLVREGTGESAFTGCAVLITSRHVAGSVRGVVDYPSGVLGCPVLPEQKEKSQTSLRWDRGKHQDLAAVIHLNHFSVRVQGCKISFWVILSCLRIYQNT